MRSKLQFFPTYSFTKALQAQQRSLKLLPAEFRIQDMQLRVDRAFTSTQECPLSSVQVENRPAWVTTSLEEQGRVRA